MKKVATKKYGIILLLLVAVTASLWFYKRFTAQKIKNVLIISIDTCRADFLGCYGFSLETTPNIDAVAKEGLLFEQAISPMPFTLPSHCSMLTGAIPPSHGVLDNGLFTLSKENVTLAEMLWENGFVSGAFVSSFVLNSDFGMDQGFDIYDDDFEKERNVIGILERQGGETTRLAIEYLEKHKDEKQFLFVHYYDPHFSYDAPEPFGSKFELAEPFRTFSSGKLATYAGYAGEIAYVDDCIGKILDKLKELGQYDSTLICITSDHGEMLGEHEEYTHGYYIYQGNIHVPLVFKIPGRKKGIRVKNTVGIVDVVPTICSALGIELNQKIRGRDLLAYYNHENPFSERYVFCQSLEPTKYNANPLLGVVSDRYKYIQTTHSELYNLEKEPLEFDNLIQREANRARLMETELLQILNDAEEDKKTTSGSGVDAKTLTLLESLGYVGDIVDDTFVIDPAKEDPKNFIEYHNMANQIGFLLQQGDYETAERTCLKMIEDRPDQYMGYYKMAMCLMRQKQHSRAIDYLLKMIKLDSENTLVYEGLAQAHRGLKQFDASIQYALQSLEIKKDSVIAYYHLSLCYYEKGMFDEPEKYLTSQIVEHPRFFQLTVSLAEKLYEKGHPVQAYKKYLKTYELNPDSPDALNSIAWFQATSMKEDIRNPQQAVQYALTACEVTKYAKAESIDTLAAAYAATGDFEKAIETAQRAIQVARSHGEDDLAGRIQKRQNLYRQRKVYVDPGL